jgi:transcriptional regulator of NAD metabolism
MNAEERRAFLLQLLQNSSSPLTGTELGMKAKVSRQVIVQDIALLRVKGAKIMATPQGYILLRSNPSRLAQHTLACRHLPEEIGSELETIVAQGGKVIDVIVEHPVYGEMRGMLMINSQEDIECLLDHLKATDAAALASLTNGIHLHTVEVESAEQLKTIRTALREKGYLLE